MMGGGGASFSIHQRGSLRRLSSSSAGVASTKPAWTIMVGMQLQHAPLITQASSRDTDCLIHGLQLCDRASLHRRACPTRKACLAVVKKGPWLR